MENSQGGGVGTLEDMVSSWSCGELLTFADLELVVGQDPVQRSVKTGACVVGRWATYAPAEERCAFVQSPRLHDRLDRNHRQTLIVIHALVYVEGRRKQGVCSSRARPHFADCHTSPAVQPTTLADPCTSTMDSSTRWGAQEQGRFHSQ
jgi:hypothetical protein